MSSSKNSQFGYQIEPKMSYFVDVLVLQKNDQLHNSFLGKANY